MSSFVSMQVQRELEKIGRGGHAYPPKNMGQVFFVDHFNGNNNYDGQHIDYPLLTITQALALCVAGRGDVILVKDAWSEATEGWPIVVNKSRVSIIGMSQGMGGKYVAILPPGDTAAFSITTAGGGCEIAGFSLGGGDTHACIEFTPAVMDCYIHDMWFGNQFHMGGNSPQDGIRNSGIHNVSNLRIERCRFLGSTGAGRGGITRYGVYSTAGGLDSWKNSEIVNNRFTCMTYAIRLTYANDFLIEHNYIMCPADDAVGRGIYLSSCGGGIIANNKAGDNGTADMTNNPYFDNTPADNAWLCNQNGVTYVFPAAQL